MGQYTLEDWCNVPLPVLEVDELKKRLVLY